MAEKVQLAAKTPKAKENSPSTTRKIESPQSMSSPADQVLYLQRTIGNQAVQRLIKSGTLQAKLKIGQPGDKYEQEADRVADAVMRMPVPQVRRQPIEEEEEEQIQTKPITEQITPLVQKQVEEEEEEQVQTKPVTEQITPLVQKQVEEEEEEQIQTKPVTEQITPLVQKQVEEEEEEQVQTKPVTEQITPLIQKQVEEEEEEELQTKTTSGSLPKVPDIESHIQSLKGGGHPLSESDRAFFEPRFGHDFSQVRVHADTQAAETARALNAQAYTVGRDVVFGEGQYAPGIGKKLLAHELTHVMHQEKSFSSVIQKQDLPKSGSTFTEQSKAKPMIHFDSRRPWLFSVDGVAEVSAISYELYGLDISKFFEKEQVFTFKDMKIRKEKRYKVFPELLREPYRAQFHQSMKKLLDFDIDKVKKILLEFRIDADDEARLIDYVKWWSARRDIRTESKQTYFDAFLERLKKDQWYTSYGLWKSKSKNYLDKLYTEVEERVGELNSLIAQNSLEFGGYRPVWARIEEQSGKEKTLQGVNEELVKKTADIVLDRLAGWTTSTESKTIADAISGLPPPEQAAVLKKIMSRYDESDWTGIFGRFGEAWEGGMLYFLFEDLSEGDRSRVAKSLKASGIISPQVVDALVAGRGWGGKYLPYTTRKGQEAAQYWADIAVKSEGGKKIDASIMGGLASLWLPETAGTTALTLITAGAGPGVAKAFPTVGKGLLVVGTGLTAYSTTIALEELITGKDAYSGEPLNDVDKLVRVLHTVSGVLLISAGFLQARMMTPQQGRSLARITPEVSGPEGGGAPNIQFRVLRADPVTGKYTVIGQNLQTGEYAVVKINLKTGIGTATNLATGETMNISGWRIQPGPMGLLPGPSAAAEPSLVPSPARGTPKFVPPRIPREAFPTEAPPIKGTVPEKGWYPSEKVTIPKEMEITPLKIPRRPPKEDIYTPIRNIRDGIDVERISNKIGLPEEEVRQARNHLFFDEHILVDNKGEIFKSRFVDTFEDIRDNWLKFARNETVAYKEIVWMKKLILHEHEEWRIMKNELIEELFKKNELENHLRRFLKDVKGWEQKRINEMLNIESKPVTPYRYAHIRAQLTGYPQP